MPLSQKLAVELEFFVINFFFWLSLQSSGSISRRPSAADCNHESYDADSEHIEDRKLKRKRFKKKEKSKSSKSSLLLGTESTFGLDPVQSLQDEIIGIFQDVLLASQNERKISEAVQILIWEEKKRDAEGKILEATM